MKPNPSLRDLAMISIQDIANYLISSGWRESETNNKKQRQFLGPNADSGKPLLLSAPANETLTDYYERVQDLIYAIASIETTSVEVALERISKVARDVLRMRVFYSLSDNHTLPLDVAAIEVEGLRDLYMWAACSEQKSAPYFEKPTSLSEQHVRSCKFGHTFEGSFGFTVTSPIVEKFEQLNLFTQRLESPFERKVTERIARGFALVSESIEKNDPSILIDNFVVGMNSRMCDALVKMSIEKQSELVFMIDWSYQLEPAPEVASLSSIRLKQPEFELIQYASEELQKVEPFEDVIIGRIVTLHSLADPLAESDRPRTAIIKHDFENRTIDVRLELTREQYLVAYEAHGKGQRISVEGNLYRKGTIWRMTDISKMTAF